MALDKFDFEKLTEERTKAIRKSIRSVSNDEMRSLGENLFKYADDPWREAFFRFIAEHPGATCYHAVTNDNVNLIYNRDADKGLWFLPGQGLGPLQARGRQVMKEASEAHR